MVRPAGPLLSGIDTPVSDAYIFHWSLQMSSTPFGEHLKREREMRGVSLEEISAATRIGTRFLVAIENEQWDQLPGGVFNRGFIRSIARFLGLDEDNLVAEYALVTDSQVNAAPGCRDQSWNSSRNWLPFVAAIIVILVVVAGGVAGMALLWLEDCCTIREAPRRCVVRGRQYRKPFRST